MRKLKDITDRQWDNVGCAFNAVITLLFVAGVVEAIYLGVTK